MNEIQEIEIIEPADAALPFNTMTRSGTTAMRSAGTLSATSPSRSTVVEAMTASARRGIQVEAAAPRPARTV